MRALKALIAATAMVAALLPAAVASGAPHTAPANFHTTCTVAGTVNLTQGGVTINRTPDHYEFFDTALDCTTVDPGKTGGKDYTAVWDVTANGDTTDENHQGLGENCDFGGSVAIGDELHTGDLKAAAGGKQLEGKVHFTRLATTVLADGPLQDLTNGTSHYFHAELEFVPTQGTCTKDDPITQASLIGQAVIDNAKGKNHDCGLDGSSDTHCN